VSIQTLIEHGPFICGTAEPLSGERREITNPGTGELVGRVTDATCSPVPGLTMSRVVRVSVLTGSPPRAS